MCVMIRRLRQSFDQKEMILTINLPFQFIPGNCLHLEFSFEKKYGFSSAAILALCCDRQQSSQLEAFAFLIHQPSGSCLCRVVFSHSNFVGEFSASASITLPVTNEIFATVAISKSSICSSWSCVKVPSRRLNRTN